MEDNLEQPQVAAPQQETPQNGDLDKLYSVVNQAGLYTKSKDEFLKKYSTPENIDKLHSVVSQAGLYTKSKDDFYNKYYPDLIKQQIQQPQVIAPKEQPITTQDLSFKNLTKTLPTGGVVPKKEGSWKNIVQNVAANVELTGTKLASGALNVVRDLSNKIVKEPELFDKEGKLTKDAANSTWTSDPLGKLIVGLNGNKKRMEGVIENNQLPNSFLGNVTQSMAEIFPDIAATAALPETKIAEGASLAAKTLGTLGNTFTKYLAGKGFLTGYDEAKMQGKSMIEASKEGAKGFLKGAETGIEMAALGVGSNVATNSIMKQAEKIGLTGAKGVGAKELVNLSTDVAAYGLISPYAHSVVEGTPLTAHDIANGSGIAAAFRFKGTVETLSKHYELNRALKETNDLRQGIALSNFTDATPESIHEVYKMPESAEELNLKALQFTKEAKETTDVEKKQNLVAKAIMYTKASNVKGVTEQIQNNPQGLDEIYNSNEIPDDVKNQFLEKAIQVKNLIDKPQEAQPETAQEQSQTETPQQGQEPQLEEVKQTETIPSEQSQEQTTEVQHPAEVEKPTTETVSEIKPTTEEAKVEPTVEQPKETIPNKEIVEEENEGVKKETPTITETKEEKTYANKDLERAKAKEVHAKVRAMDEPTKDPRQIALRYLADGNKVGQDAINEIAGTVKRARLNTGEKELKSAEAKARDYTAQTKDLKEAESKGWDLNSLDNIAEKLAEKHDVDVSEMKDALMEAIGEHNTRLEAGQSYLERYNPDYAEEQHYARLAEERAEEFDKELKDINDWLTSEGEKEHPLEAQEEHINNLIKQYEAEFKAENQQSQPESKGETTEKTSSRTGGEEAKSEISQEVKDKIKKQIEDNTKVESISKVKIGENSKNELADVNKQKEAMKDYSDFKKIIECLYGVR